MKRFFNDFSKALAYTTASIVFLINYGNTIDTYLVDNSIISYTDEGIIIPFLADIYWYLLTAVCVSFASYAWVAYKGFRSELNIDLGLFIFWITAFLCLIFCLAKPTNWFGIAFCLFALFGLFWLLVRYVWFSIKEYN